MKSFLRNIGTLIEEDGEDVLPTQMQPLSIEDFDDYLSPWVKKEKLYVFILTETTGDKFLKYYSTIECVSYVENLSDMLATELSLRYCWIMMAPYLP